MPKCGPAFGWSPVQTLKAIENGFADIENFTYFSMSPKGLSQISMFIIQSRTAPKILCVLCVSSAPSALKNNPAQQPRTRPYAGRKRGMVRPSRVTDSKNIFAGRTQSPPSP